MVLRSAATPYLLLTLAPLFWACNWIIGRSLAVEVPPFAMAFHRWLFASAILAPVALPHVRRDWPRIRAHWRVLVLLAVLGGAAHNALTYVGLAHTTVTNGVILNSFIPVMIVALSWLFLRERLRGPQLLGITVSLAGVLAILAGGSLYKLASLSLNPGDLVIVASMGMWSLYTIALRWKPAGLHMLSFLFVIAIVGDLAVLPFYAGEMALGVRVTWSWTVVASVGAVALFSSVLAYLFWNWGVEAVGANVAGLFVHLMPAFGIVLAWAFLGERIEAYHVVGIALILSGISLASRHRRRRPDVEEAAAVGTD